MDAEREFLFWSLFERDGPLHPYKPDLGKCWIWSGSLTKSGYGQFSVNGQSRTTHSLSFELTSGPVENGHVVCHSCDVRNCGNPKHLFQASQKENLLDAVEKGRMTHGMFRTFVYGKPKVALPKGTATAGERNRHAKLTEDKVIEIRKDARPYRLIATDYGIAEVTVSAIRRGLLWSHLPINGKPIIGRPPNGSSP